MNAYTRHGRALLRKAERMLQSRDDAQDIVQGLFVDLLRDGNVEPDLPYLYRAVTNRCLTFLRDEENRSRLLHHHDEALRGAPRTRCDDRIIDMDLLLRLTRMLDELTMEVLFFRFFDDMTQEEIASVLGISRKTVGKRLEDVSDAVKRLSGSKP